MFHWGLHPWAIYAVVGLSLALITYNLRLPLSIRSVLYPIPDCGTRARAGQRHRHTGRVRRAVRPGDFAGPWRAAALAGLHHLYGIEINAQNKIILVIVISAIALGSVVAGIGRASSACPS